jgi:hypothetical protein
VDFPGTFGIHVCECCGQVYETLGPYWDCQDSHTDEELAAAYKPAIDAYRAGRKAAMRLYPEVHDTLREIHESGALVVDGPTGPSRWIIGDMRPPVGFALEAASRTLGKPASPERKSHPGEIPAGPAYQAPPGVRLVGRHKEGAHDSAPLPHSGCRSAG